MILTSKVNGEWHYEVGRGRPQLIYMASHDVIQNSTYFRAKSASHQYDSYTGWSSRSLMNKGPGYANIPNVIVSSTAASVYPTAEPLPLRQWYHQKLRHYTSGWAADCEPKYRLAVFQNDVNRPEPTFVYVTLRLHMIVLRELSKISVFLSCIAGTLDR